MNDVTTIRIHQETKKELDEFKVHEREPYEEVLERLMKEIRETDKFTEREKAVKSFVRKIKKEHREEVVEIILYGSYARGEADTDSDVDILIIWEGDLSEGREYTAKLATEALMEHDVILSPKVISRENYEAMEESEVPFIENVEREGIRVE